MEQPSPILPLLSDEELSDEARQVLDDIRATRGTDYVNNVWRVLANDPAQLRDTWEEVNGALQEGELSTLVKQLIYIAVSSAHGCDYCIRSHTHAARALGATDGQLAELYRVIGVAAKTNRMVMAMQVPVDEAFL